jgi:hypothetical protein
MAKRLSVLGIHLEGWPARKRLTGFPCSFAEEPVGWIPARLIFFSFITKVQLKKFTNTVINLTVPVGNFLARTRHANQLRHPAAK